MATSNTYSMLAAERTAFADYLTTLDAADWAQPSLCAGWTVRDVVAHVADGAALTPAIFLLDLIRSKFSVATMNSNGIARESEGTTEELIGRLKSRATNRSIFGKAMLSEVVTHAEDVRAALAGSAVQHLPEALLAVASQFVSSPAPIGGKKRVAGLALESTDIPWVAGSGPLVRGPLVALILAISGRPAGLADLSGPGLAELTNRLAPPPTS